MQEVEDLHRKAMEAADLADLARLRGDMDTHGARIREAFDLERRAANLLAGSDLEPSRSVLHRSAASLALECREHREAERLIATGLGGSPPEEVLDELRSLFQDVHFHQHLQAEGISLAEEFQYTMIGGQVGEGIAPSAEFMRRFDILDKLVFRTAERKANKPFRTQGRRDSSIQASVELFVKVPKAASFAIGFRVGRKGFLPGMDPAVDVVDDMLRCFDHFARAEVEPLKHLIPDKDYFDNFVSLATRLAPDGKHVGTTGLSGMAAGRPRAIVLKPESGTPFKPPEDATLPREVDRVTIEGMLLLADAERSQYGLIEVVGPNGKTRFKVSPAIMSDVVRPFFGSVVVVTGHKKGKTYHLDDIKQPS